MSTGLDLRIGRRTYLASLIKNAWATTLIQAVNDDRADLLPRPPAIPGYRDMILKFRDTTDHEDPTSMSSELAEEYVAFVRQITDSPAERVVVHCTAGKGRSPALAFGLLVAVGREPRQAFADMLVARPIAKPNALIVIRLDDALGCDGQMFQAYLEWASVQEWWPLKYGAELSRQPRAEQLRAVKAG